MPLGATSGAATCRDSSGELGLARRAPGPSSYSHAPSQENEAPVFVGFTFTYRALCVGRPNLVGWRLLVPTPIQVDAELREPLHHVGRRLLDNGRTPKVLRVERRDFGGVLGVDAREHQDRH